MFATLSVLEMLDVETSVEDNWKERTCNENSNITCHRKQ